MSDGRGALDLSIDRLVLDGLDPSEEAATTLGDLVATELRRILDGGGSGGAGATAGAEREPIILSTPPDVSALARVLAERIAAQTDVAGAWDG
jgi:hypothetical protein